MLIIINNVHFYKVVTLFDEEVFPKVNEIFGPKLLEVILKIVNDIIFEKINDIFGEKVYYVFEKV